MNLNMPNEVFIAENDDLLAGFLAAGDDIVAENEGCRLFKETVIPKIKMTLTSHSTLSSSEKDEISSDTQTKIWGKLRRLRLSVQTDGSLKPIKNLTAFISTVTENCRKDFILSKNPEWRRICNRLKRLSDEPETDWKIFKDDEENKIIGWKHLENKKSNIETEKIAEMIREKYERHLFLKIQELVPIILETAEGALAKNDVIKIILEVTETARFEEVGMPEEAREIVNFDENEYVLQERHQKTLRLIWNEIIKFPPNQRKVLLLGLRESAKVEAITLFLQKRIATIEEIAVALDLSLAEFSSLFARLPLSSREIADFLGIEAEGKTSKEQRVDNLRKAGRKLLNRKLGIGK